MPKAFTHLCKKVNLSLYDNTLTVYPKSSMQKTLPPIRNEMDLLFVLLFSQMDCVSAQVNDFFMLRANELGIYRFVHRDDSDHNLYHQDDFSIDDTHYHAQFSATIDESKLENILDTLEKYSIITSEEHSSFMKAYHQANVLPHDVTVSKKDSLLDSSSELKKQQLITEKEKEQPTFGGFKRGFFLTMQRSKNVQIVEPEVYNSMKYN